VQKNMPGVYDCYLLAPAPNLIRTLRPLLGGDLTGEKATRDTTNYRVSVWLNWLFREREARPKDYGLSQSAIMEGGNRKGGRDACIRLELRYADIEIKKTDGELTRKLGCLKAISVRREGRRGRPHCRKLTYLVLWEDIVGVFGV